MKIMLTRIFIHRFPLRERPVDEQKVAALAAESSEGAVLRMARAERTILFC